jgi:hypothetical protein
MSAAGVMSKSLKARIATPVERRGRKATVLKNNKKAGLLDAVDDSRSLFNAAVNH